MVGRRPAFRDIGMPPGQAPRASSTDIHRFDSADMLPTSLESFALAGLARCWMPERGTWSHKYHLDGRAVPNESMPASDLYYSLNVLLGLSRLTGLHPSYCVLRDMPARLCAAAETVPVRHGFWGMALWVAACLNVDPPPQALAHMYALGNDSSPMLLWRAQDLGLALSGICAHSARDREWIGRARVLSSRVLEQLRGPGALFRDCGHGPRRHVATFATQIYAALSMYHYGELTGDLTPINVANACVRHLLSLQGKQGEWPWLYAVGSGRVLDRYEVFSVHQHGMAPALLHHAAAHGVEGAKAALVRGFEWLFGENELGVSMLRPELCMIVRSQARRGMAGGRGARLLRAGAGLAMSYHAHVGTAAGAAALMLTQEMRSYELGWLLWSFAGRKAYSGLAERSAFSQPAPANDPTPAPAAVGGAVPCC